MTVNKTDLVVGGSGGCIQGTGVGPGGGPGGPQIQELDLQQASALNTIVSEPSQVK